LFERVERAATRFVTDGDAPAAVELCVSAANSCIPPGEPWRNGYVESFNSRIRDINSFWSMAQARVIISDWKHECNRHRLHSSLGYPGAGPLRCHQRRT